MDNLQGLGPAIESHDAEDSNGGGPLAGTDEEEGGAIEPASINESDNAHMNLRFETYGKDVSLVWMEAAAEFRAFNQHGVFTLNDIGRIGDNIRDTYRFLSERCTKFLEQWDVPRSPEVGEP